MIVIDTPACRIQDKILAAALHPVRPLLPTGLIESWCHLADHHWRVQVFCPVVTLLACVFKQLHRASARQVEDWIASLAPTSKKSLRDGADFCAARSRLPLSVFGAAVRHVGREATHNSSLFLRGLAVWLVDGTTLRTPNTPENEKFFGRSWNAARQSRTPLARMVVLVSAGCGAVLDLAIGPYLTSELALFKELLLRLPAGGLIVGDTTYGSYLMVSLVLQRGSHVLSRHNPSRRSRRIKRLGRGDEVQRWHRPAASQVSAPELLASCPDFIDMRVITARIERRGYRTWTLRIATTLIERTYAADELIDTYLQRWDVELDLRTLKSGYGMALLSGKRPDIVLKEVHSIVLAYNCVLALMGWSGGAVRQLSHSRARALIRIFSERMAAAATIHLPRLNEQLLLMIGQAVLLHQQRPPQPRAIIQRPSTYPVLMTSRRQWLKDYYAA
jgi:hypothetical protein